MGPVPTLQSFGTSWQIWGLPLTDKVLTPDLKCSCHSWSAVTRHRCHTLGLWAAQVQMAAGKETPVITGMVKWQTITRAACIIPLSCDKCVAQMISLAVQVASRMCVVLTGWRETGAVLRTKDVPVSLMSSTSTEHILSNSVWRKTCVS